MKIRKNNGSIGDAWTSACHSSGISALARDLGYSRGTAKTKRLPSAIWKETLENRRSFLEGYYAADGSKNRPMGTVHCANPDLLREAQIASATPIGIHSHFKEYADGTAQVSAHAPGQSRGRGIAKGARFYGLNDDYDFKIFKSAERLGIIEDTYTLAVFHDDHRFDSEGIISKNTGGGLHVHGHHQGP